VSRIAFASRVRATFTLQDGASIRPGSLGGYTLSSNLISLFDFFSGANPEDSVSSESTLDWGYGFEILTGPEEFWTNFGLKRGNSRQQAVIRIISAAEPTSGQSQLGKPAQRPVQTGSSGAVSWALTPPDSCGGFPVNTFVVNDTTA